MKADDQRQAWRDLEKMLGYTFVRHDLLEAALTCPSYRAEHAGESGVDNQRLEFLGDAVINLLAAEHVFMRHASEGEGGLTLRRSRLASGRALAARARALGLGQFLLMGRAEEAAGGRNTERASADAMEAIFGAAWCDGGLPAARAVFDGLLSRMAETPTDPWEDNPKGCLQELAQRHGWPESPIYRCERTRGSLHEPVYAAWVEVAGGFSATGEGRTKRAAEAEAAGALIEKLRNAGFF